MNLLRQFVICPRVAVGHSLSNINSRQTGWPLRPHWYTGHQKINGEIDVEVVKKHYFEQSGKNRIGANGYFSGCLCQQSA